MLYKELVIDLQPQERRRVYMRGRFLRLVENSLDTSPSVAIQSEELIKFPVGLAVALPEGEFFNWFDVMNTASEPMQVRFYLSDGKVEDSRFVLTGRLPVDNSGDTLDTAFYSIPASPTVVSIPAKSKTIEVIVQNTGSGVVWIGNQGLSSTSKAGVRLAAGASVVLRHNGPLYAMADGATASSVSVVWIRVA